MSTASVPAKDAAAATVIKTNGARLSQSIAEIARIGALPNGGNCRLALSDEDKEARDLFASWCRDAGCEVQADSFGNIFAFRRGTNPDAPIVLTGSHLDTQPHGGNYDGIYGVLAGLEVVRALNDAKVHTDATIAVVNWTNEEGVRYSPGLTGSSAFVGSLAAEQALKIVGSDKSVFGDEVQRIGYSGPLTRQALNIGCYIEAHIEQGPVLESFGLPIGVVSGIQGVRWYEVTVDGADRHAGTTPMSDRQDSFMASAEFALEARAFALGMSPDIRFTIGRMAVSPGSPNTVPGRTTFTIDLRHEQETVLDKVESYLVNQAGPQHKSGTVLAVKRIMHVPPVHFAEEKIEAVAAAADGCGLRSKRMVSGAMHDASRLASVVPTAMIFVPSRDGISHHEDEWTAPEDLERGCDVLAQTLLSLAGTV